MTASREQPGPIVSRPLPARCLIVVPAFNEQPNIGQTVREIRSAFPAAFVLVVNDGSADETAAVAREAGAAVLDLPFNLGIGGAVEAGLKYAVREGYEFAVQVDGDGQHPAEQIPRLLEPILDRRADAVIGSRFLPGSAGFRPGAARRTGIRLFQSLNRLLIGQTITDSTSGFRAYGRRALEFLAELYPRDYPEPETVVHLARHGFGLLEVPVSMRIRQSGSSSIRGLGEAYYMVKVILALLIEMLRKRRGGG